MNDTSVTGWRKELFAAFFEFRPGARPWHVPVLAALSVGLPILSGYFLGNVRDGVLASIAGLVILYMPSSSLANRMITLIACSFGLILSFFIGFSFSFNTLLSSLVLGVYVSAVHWLTKYFRLAPPGNFFFILVAAIASCMPFNAAQIPLKVGLIAMGTIGACTLALLFSLLSMQKQLPEKEVIIVNKNRYTYLTESAVWGIFVALSLYLAHLLELDNPYWVPTSCAAVMQGVNTTHILRRSFHRVLGTFLGLGLAWLLLLLRPSLMVICFSIIILQFIVEVIVVKNYTVAVIFITTLTIFLAESGNPAAMGHPDKLVLARMLDIILGSAIGAVGGWILYHRKLHRNLERQIRKTKIVVKKSRR